MKNRSTVTARDLLRIGAALIIPVCLAAPANGQDNPHKTLSFSCESCHTTASFREIVFDHGKTDYDLLDRHQTVDCAQCHDIRDFRSAGRECRSCHQDVHQAKMGPDCQKCHTPYAWTFMDSEEIHAETNFPMMGRHVLLDCQSCHEGSPVQDLSLEANDCAVCHRQQYLDAAAPDHVSFGFATECRQCHQMNSWQPAFLPDHDGLFFPIYSGEHNGAWAGCADCHIDPLNRAAFSCLTCHDHNQSKTDQAHTGMAGYAYESNQCYACHPTGKKGDFRAHDSQFFPIFSGKHQGRWDSCATCHNDPGNRALFSCITCHEHNQSRMDDKHLGKINGYVFDSAACFDCHPNGRHE